LGIQKWAMAYGTIDNINPGSRGGPTAACTDGRVVTGGYAAIGPSGKVLAKRPAVDGSAFLATGENDEMFGSPSQLSVMGICIARPAGYMVTQTSRTIPAHGRAQLEATCPAGTALIGGGASTESGVYLAMSAPKLDGSAWATYFRSDVLWGDKKVEAYAVCAAQNVIPGREIISSPPSQFGPGTQVTFSLVCPPGKKALSVGHYVTSTTVNQPALSWLSPQTKADPRNHISMPAETWSGGITNTSSLIDNVTLEARIVLLCANASF
jgi:hypothetical protein